MENKISINTGNLKEKIQNRVKDQFLDLFPEDSLNEFIDQTTKEFTEKELPKLIDECLREHAKEEIKTLLNTNSFGFWDSEKNRTAIHPYLEEMIINAAPAMFGQVMRDVAITTMQSVSSNIY